MNRKQFFEEMDELQARLDNIRSILFQKLEQLMSGKSEVNLSDEDNTDGNAPLIYHDGDSIEVTKVFKNGSVHGIGDEAKRTYTIDMAELGIDDIKAIIECLARVVIKK